MTRWPVRSVVGEDLALLVPWLPAGAEATLPSDDADAWLLISRPQGPAACLRLRHRIGERWPRHWFHVGCVVHAVPELELFNRQTTLLLGNDHTGASELADFACAPGLSPAEQSIALRGLLQAMWQHMQQHRAVHAGPVIFELPGWRDEHGQSPFWRDLGRHFYEGDPDALARQQGPHWRSDLALLLPRQPLYTAFLAEPARQAIAQTALGARTWMAALTHAGFRYSHHIGIVDGGPVFEAHLDSWSDNPVT